MSKKEMVIAVVALIVGVAVGSLFLGGSTTSMSLGGQTSFSGVSVGSDGLSVTGDVTVDTNDLFVDISTNKSGFGTSTPQSRLHIEDAPAGDGTIATTTLITGQVGTTTSRSSIQLKQADGGVSCAYINAAGTGWVVENAACN